MATRTRRQAATMLVAFACVALSTMTLVAQTWYYNPDNNAASLPQLRTARLLPANPFPAVHEAPPKPSERPTIEPDNSVRYAALTKTFAATESPAGLASKRVASSGNLQDIFGENPTQDPFGEKPQQAAGNPFQKVAPESPFGLLPTDPSPKTPPMDTRPSAPQTGSPAVLPPGFEFTPNPNRISPIPPTPGQEDPPSQNNTDPQLQDPVLVPETDNDDPGEITGEDPDESVFDRVDPPDDNDLPPVPAPASSRVYLPASTPSDYENPLSRDGTAVHRGYERGHDPRYAGRNPYAALPGPYGYRAAPESHPPYPPYMMPPMGPYGAYGPYGYGPGYGPGYGYGYGQHPQCGPGCRPITENENQCGLLCDPCTISQHGGCNRCNTCSNSTRPMLPQTDIGDRILDTGLVDSCGCDPCCDQTYTEVVTQCDDLCSNYASCYVGLFGGVSNVSDFITQDENGRGVYFDDSGSIFGVAIGQVQGRNLRTELELSYRNIGISGLRLEGDAPSEFLAVNGDFGTFSGMLNGYWEFVDVRFNKVKPYIGAGVGFAIARPELLQADGFEAVIDNEDSSFAYQWMAGLNYKASPTLDAFVEYRYFVADSFQLDTEIPLIDGLGNGSGQFDFRSSNVIFGMRARF